MDDTQGWSSGETRTLISLWSDESIQQKLSRTYRNKAIYEDISQKMREHGYGRTWQQCQRKIKSLKIIYRKAKDNNSKSGRARVTCPFYEVLDRVLGDKPSFVPGEGEVLDTASLSEDVDVEGGVDETDSIDIPSSEAIPEPTPKPTSEEDCQEPVFDRAKGDRGAVGSRKRKTKLEATVECFAKALSDNLSREMQLTMQMQAAQNEHEARMFGMMIQAITNTHPMPPQGPQYSMPFPAQNPYLHHTHTNSPGPMAHSPQPTYLPHTPLSGRRYPQDEDQETHTFTPL